MPQLRAVLLVVVAATALPSSAFAQVVRGVVREDGTGAAMSGAIVVLLDSTGRRAASVLAGDDGRYAVRAPAPGRYTIRAERIGFRSAASAPLALSLGETREQMLVASSVPVRLAGVRVSAVSQCDISRGNDVAAAWGEARKALEATALTSAQESFDVRVARFERTLDPGTGRVRRAARSEFAGQTRNPFVSAPMEQLHRDGYVQVTDTATIYHAPDEHVLLDESFLLDHCFRVSRDARGHRGQLGLEFSPVATRRVSDVAGVLWLDESTSELRTLVYHYTNPPAWPTDASLEDFGGHLEFRRLSTGAWIVEHWLIRSPIIGRAPGHYLTSPGGSGLATNGRLVVQGVHEEGGDVLETIVRGTRTRIAGPSGTITGTVFDSTRATPLVGARVFLDGTQYVTTSDSAGHFVLDGVPDGSYTVSLMHERLDSLGIRAPTVVATISGGGAFAASLGVPSLATVVGIMCNGSDAQPGRTAMLHGTVRHAIGGGVTDAAVAVSWNSLGSPVSRSPTVRQQSITVQTDSNGRYVACGLPDDVQIDVIARHEQLSSRHRRFVIPRGLPTRLDLVVGSGFETSPLDTTPQPSRRPNTNASR